MEHNTTGDNKQIGSFLPAVVGTKVSSLNGNPSPVDLQTEILRSAAALHRGFGRPITASACPADGQARMGHSNTVDSNRRRSFFPASSQVLPNEMPMNPICQPQRHHSMPPVTTKCTTRPICGNPERRSSMGAAVMIDQALQVSFELSSSTSTLSPSLRLSRDDYCSMFGAGTSPLRADKRRRRQEDPRGREQLLHSAVSGMTGANGIKPKFQSLHNIQPSETRSTPSYITSSPLHLPRADRCNPPSIYGNGETTPSQTELISPETGAGTCQNATSRKSASATDLMSGYEDSDTTADRKKVASATDLIYGYEDPDRVAAKPSRRRHRRAGGPIKRRGSVTKFSFETRASLASLAAATSMPTLGASARSRKAHPTANESWVARAP